MITQRDAVSNSVADDLTARAETFGIYLDDISITHLSFGAEFARAVESKQVAQQEAERSRYYVEKVMFFFSIPLRLYSICFQVHILEDGLLFYVCS